MVDFCLIIPGHGGRGIEQNGKQILPDVFHFRRIGSQAVKHIADMPVFKPHELAPHNLRRILIACD